MRQASPTTPAPDSPWSRLPTALRDRVAQSLWLLTWIGLLLGHVDARFFEAVVALSALQAVVVLALVGGRPRVFPAQLRIAYLAWVALGTYVPSLWVLMPITTLGLAALLGWGYCPLARMLYLLPWNRTHALTRQLAWQVLTQPPAQGQFVVTGTLR